MTQLIRIISPIDNQVVAERPLAETKEIEACVKLALRAQKEWQTLSIQKRGVFSNKAIDAILAQRNTITAELTRQMGRSIAYSPFELRGLEERARYMISIAEKELADLEIVPKEGFTRFIRRDPLGIVFTIAPWNYPYQTAVNSIIPALMAGNAVILRWWKKPLGR